MAARQRTCLPFYLWPVGTYTTGLPVNGLFPRGGLDSSTGGGGVWEEAHLVVEAWVDSQKVSVLLDSGCTRTLVQPIGQPIDATLLVQCIHGDICLYHLQWAKMQVRTWTDCQFMKVGVVPPLNYGLVVGRDWPQFMQLLQKAIITKGAPG